MSTDARRRRSPPIEEALEDIRRGQDGRRRRRRGPRERGRPRDGRRSSSRPRRSTSWPRQARGLICLALTPERCDELGLELMAAKNESPFETAVHRHDRGARGRHHRHLAPPTARTRSRSRSTPRRGPRDLVQPGHVFPLKAKPGGVLERTGHTEAAVDLARLAGLEPGRRDLRDHERGRHDGARAATSPRYCAQARPEDDHDRRPDRLPPPPRQARRARRRDARCRPAFGEFDGRRLPLAGRRQAPRRAGQGRRRRRARTCSCACTPSA